eukprot:9856868-Prorocentrum_lima.AAC.1
MSRTQNLGEHMILPHKTQDLTTEEKHIRLQCCKSGPVNKSLNPGDKSILPKQTISAALCYV